MSKDKFDLMEASKLYKTWFSRLNNAGEDPVFVMTRIQEHITANNAVDFEEAAIEFAKRVEQIIKG